MRKEENSGETQQYLYAADIEAIGECSRPTAINRIKKLNGEQTHKGWRVSAQAYYESEYCRDTNHIVVDDSVKDIELHDLLIEFNKKWEILGNLNDFNLYKKKNRGGYYLRLYGKKKSEAYLNLKTNDEDIAKDRLESIRSKLDEQKNLGIKIMRTNDVIAKFIDYKRTNNRNVHFEGGCSIKTTKKYEYILEKALESKTIPEFICETNENHIKQYLAFLDTFKYDGKRYYKKRTIGDMFYLIRSFYDYAEGKGYVNKNPTRYLVKPKKPDTKIFPYQDEQIERITNELQHKIDSAKNEKWKFKWEMHYKIFDCLNNIGARISDVLIMRKLNIKTNDNDELYFDFIQKKTNLQAMPSVCSEYEIRLRELIERKNDDDLLFTDLDGRPITYHSFSNALNRVLKECGIKKKSPVHSIRHTVACRLVKRMSVDEVAAELGDTIATVQKYYIKPDAPSREKMDAAYGCKPEVREDEYRGLRLITFENAEAPGVESPRRI